MRKISEDTIKKIEKELNHFEQLDSKLERAVKTFFRAMVATNKKIIASDTASVAYSRVYYYLKNTVHFLETKDFSCFYNERVINTVIYETVGTEKLCDMHKAAVAVHNIVLEIYSSRNKMYEMAEDYAETVELIDAIEILLLNRGIALKKVHHEISKLKKASEKEFMIA